MAAFSIPSEPDFNVTHVEQVKESDYVLNTFVNGYFQTFLQNDRYLLNQNQALETSLDEKISNAQPDAMTDAELQLEIAKFA
jgi:hypothetical protein